MYWLTFVGILPEQAFELEMRCAVEEVRGPVYERYAAIPLEEGLALLREAFANRLRRCDIEGQSVNTHSLRLRTFAMKGGTCMHCGLKATHFALERMVRAVHPRYHLNLWGIDANGDEVLFTHDHIVPRSRGGLDVLENAQPMCGPCNWRKKNRLEEELVPAGAVPRPTAWDE